MYWTHSEREPQTGSMNLRSLLTAVLVAGCAAHDGHEGHARLGQVHFPVDCNAAAQREFDLAMAYYHSFAWAQIQEPLERVLQADPQCGMAYWAKAVASLDNAGKSTEATATENIPWGSM